MSYLGKPPLQTPSLWQSVAYFFNNFNTTDQGWITGTDHILHNLFFRTQWVICTYQTSGSYSSTPRYIFYALALLSILARKTPWGVPVALVTVIIYSSTAAIHAIVAAVAALTQLTTRLAAIQENYEVVLIDGQSQTGRLERGLLGGPIWLPVLPVVYEPDADAVLAIVGFAFLCLLPMQVMSETLRNTKLEQKIIVLAWSILLWFGLVGAFTIDIFVTIWFFPQLRFCPPDQADTLPTFSNGPPAGVESWDRKDWYRWNRTIRDDFIFNNSSAVFPNNCIYPCSGFSWPLRDPTDIIFNHFSLSDRPPISAKFVVALYIAACVVVVLFTGANLTVLFMIRPSANFEEARASTAVSTALKRFCQAWSSRDCTGLSRYWRLIVRAWILIVMAFAQGPSIVTNLFFIGVKEYSIWWGGLNEETFRHIGQWGVLVSTVLLFAAVWSARGEQAGTPEAEQQQQQQQTTATATAPTTTATAPTTAPAT
jgi:hypothetical protein